LLRIRKRNQEKKYTGGSREVDKGKSSVRRRKDRPFGERRGGGEEDEACMRVGARTKLQGGMKVRFKS